MQPQHQVSAVVLTRLSQLVSLSFTFSPVGDEQLPRIAAFTQLTSLALDGTQISDQGISTLAVLPKLTFLGIGSTKVTGSGLERLSAFPSLSNINLFYTGVSDDSLRHLRSLPAGLKAIGVSSDVGPKGIAALRGAPIGNVQIAADITKGKIGDEFLESLVLFPDLHTVHLSQAVIDASVMKHLSQIDNLKNLNLYMPRVADGAFKPIVASAKLELLDIYAGGEISDATFQPLAALKNLKTLNLPLTTVAPASVMKLQTALPNCKITVDREIQQAVDALRGKK